MSKHPETYLYVVLMYLFIGLTYIHILNIHILHIHVLHIHILHVHTLPIHILHIHIFSMNVFIESFISLYPIKVLAIVINPLCFNVAKIYQNNNTLTVHVRRRKLHTYFNLVSCHMYFVERHLIYEQLQVPPLAHP